MKSSTRVLVFSGVLILSLILSPVSTAFALTVPAQINKEFTPIAIVSGASSTLRVSVYNLNQNPLTNASWTDDLTLIQPGLSIANPPNVVNTCGGTITEGGGGSLDPGDTSFQLNNGTVPAVSSLGFPGECYVEVDITSTTPGNLINRIPSGALTSTTLDGGTPVSITNTDPAEATLNVIGVADPSLSKSFAPNTIFVGDTSTLTITVHNNDTTNPLNDVTLTDSLPISGGGEVELASPVNANLSGCGAGTLTDSGGVNPLIPGGTTIRLNNGTIAPNSNCVISVDVTSTVQGSYTGVNANTIPAGPAGPGSIQTREGVTNGSPASAPLNVQAFTLTKAFATSPIAAGDTSVVTITIQNHAPFDYTGVVGPIPPSTLDDVLPADLQYVDGTQSTTCGAGTVTVVTTTNTDDTVRLVGGTIPANSFCTITATAMALSSAAGTYTNTIPIGALSTTLGATNHAPASANLDVTSLTIGKAFSPTTFPAGQTSTLTITITNPTTSIFTNATLSDSLPTSPNTNLFFTGAPTTSCGPGVVGISTNNYANDTITLTNGTIPASSSCTITAAVTTLPGVAPANGYDNNIPAGALSIPGGPTNTNSPTATVNVSQVSVNKSFNPGTVIYPGTSLLTITIFNPVGGGALTDIELTDTLLPQLEIVAAPAPATTCDDSSVPILTAVAGTQTITLDNGSLPAAPGPGAVSCTITVTVRPLASASSGTYSNTINPFDVVATDQGVGNGNSTTANLTVQAIGLSKAFLYANFEAENFNTLTITITNPTGTAYTGVAVSDTLPTVPDSNLEFVPGSAATTCVGGTASLSGAPPRTVSLAGGTVPAGGSCTITATVTTAVGASDASYTNVIPATTLVTSEGPTNPNDVTADVDVYTVGEGVPSTKSFSPATILIFGNSRLRLEFTAPADTDLTGFTFTDTLPPEVTVSNSTPPTYSNCGTLGGAWPPANGAGVISASGGAIPAGTTCTVDVWVTSVDGSTSGEVYTNTILPGDVDSNENRTMPGPISATLTVQSPPDLDVTKAFYPGVVNPGGLSTLTITLENSNTSALINVSLTDNLPGNTTNGVVIAPTPNDNTTCGGTVIAVAGTQLISLTNGTVPAQVGGVNGLCTVNVDVQGLGVLSTYNNNIPAAAVTAQIAGNPSIWNANNPATDSLTIQNLDLEIVKGFDPVLVFGGTDSEMTIILRNPNPSAELVDITFTDNMWLDPPDPDAYPPGEMILSNPPNFDPSDCDPPGGPPAVLTGTAGTSTFTFSGGYLAPSDSCTITLNATMIVNGNRTNRIPAGAVTTFNGATNGTATAASLTNLAGASIAKSFAPNPVSAGLNSWSILTITIRTTATVAITGMGLVDNLPPGLQVAGGAAPAPTNTCGGTFSAPAGATSVQLTNGSLPIGFDNCFLTVPVTGANPGTYTNTIPDNTLITDQGVSNRFPAIAPLTLTPYSLGNQVWFDTDNNGLLDTGEVGVSGVRVELYRDDGTTPGVFDAGDTYFSFRTTNASGYYRFDDLGGGDYIVLIPDVNFNTGGAPLAGYLSSGTSMAANGVPTDSIGFPPNNDIDDDDNGVTTFSGQSVNYVSSQVVTLGPGGSEPTNDNNPTTNPEPGEAVNDQSNRTVDFGFYRQQLGNQIFQDFNENGAFDAGESPLTGAIVQLFAGNGTTEINVGPDGILGTGDDAPGGMTSAATGTPGNPTGNYLFSGLPEGDYVVKVLPTGFPSTVDTFNPFDTASPNDNVDDNDNGVGTTGLTASSNLVTLTPGNAGALANNVVTGATGTTYNPTVDFGYVTNLEKRIVSTDAAHTTDPDVTIGEIITYDVLMKIPDGGLTGVQLVDAPQPGLAFVDCVSITLPAPVTSSIFGAGGACDTLDGTAPGSNPLIASSGGLISFDLGDITNNTGATQIIGVRYSLIVLDIITNQSGDSRTNNVTWTWNGGSRSTSAPLVQIVEPELTIVKNATPTTVNPGDTVTFTLDVSHAISSLADAFDVVVTDQIPSGMTYNAASLVVGGSATLTSSNYDPGTRILRLVWDVIRLGETASISFTASYLGPPPVINSATAAWSSIEIDPIPGPPPTPVQLSPYNTNSTERWFNPASPAVDSYGASASVTLDVLRADRPDELPNTGFAPGRVTRLPEQPSDLAYADLGELWLEIPSLGLKTQIVGVPKMEDGWDIQWLWDQAGYLEGTAYPSLAGNSVITAHVYTPDGLPGPFVDLHKLGWGDQIIIHAFGERYIYEVRYNLKVSPQASAFKHEEYPWVTLVTCQGYNEGDNSYRYRILVRAVQIKVEPE